MKAREIINEADTITVKNVRALLRDHPEAILHMHDPSPELVHIAIQNSSYPEEIISRVKNLDGKMLLALLKDNPELIEYIRKPTEKMWLVAINNDPSLIIKIPTSKQTPALQMAAYQSNPSVLKDIEKPSPELIKLAVEQGHSKYLAHAIDITDAKTQLDAVKASAKSAYHMKENMKPATLKWLFKNNRYEVVVGVISNSPLGVIEESKKEIIRFILRCIKEGSEMGYPYDYPNMRSFLYAGKQSLIKWLEAKGVKWPELEIIKNSLKAMKPRQLGE